MALSLLNFFIWKNEDALFPFLVADVTIIFAFHALEKSMRGQRELRVQAEKDAFNLKHEDDKTTKAAVKMAQREQQKRNVKQSMGKGKGSSVAHTNSKINQPNKTK